MPSIEFELADAIVAAVNAASSTLNVPITARITTQPSVSLEGVDGIIVWVKPDANTKTPLDLEGNVENDVSTNIIVGKNLVKGSDEEVRALHELTEQILTATLAAIDGGTYVWQETDAEELWDVNQLGNLFFFAERFLRFKIPGPP